VHRDRTPEVARPLDANPLHAVQLEQLHQLGEPWLGVRQVLERQRPAVLVDHRHRERVLVSIDSRDQPITSTVGRWAGDAHAP